MIHRKGPGKESIKHIVLSISVTISLYFNSIACCQVSAPEADTLTYKPKWHQTNAFRTLAAPSILAGYGLFTTNNRGFPYSNYEAYREIRKRYPNFHTRVDNFTAVLPGAAVYGLNLAGIKGKNDFADRTIIYGLSSLIALSTVLGLKEIRSNIRPDSSSYNSFPSGHTAGAFVSAEFMHQEFRDVSIWYSVAGYSVASLTGAMRMLNNRHWLSDVLVGAGIGMVSTKIIYLVYPWIDEKINKKINRKIGFMPFYDGYSAGMVVVCVLK